MNIIREELLKTPIETTAYEGKGILMFLSKKDVENIISYLKSQNVVRRVDRGLPVLRLLSYANKKTAAQAYRNAQNDMLKAGYVTVEDLE